MILSYYVFKSTGKADKKRKNASSPSYLPSLYFSGPDLRAAQILVVRSLTVNKIRQH
ncbi:Uncharacterized protein dnm_098520 [Desulfonema magnum]|uniref:Uncharacterized protein n=1 Tax=Desulfonema magnum TaxID=45655 RepID=A0A975GW38_9BACT|nr:Uncharacterized protein dnm_098520 [Desulfonema magnum]